MIGPRCIRWTENAPVLSAGRVGADQNSRVNLTTLEFFSTCPFFRIWGGPFCDSVSLAAPGPDRTDTAKHPDVRHAQLNEAHPRLPVVHQDRHSAGRRPSRRRMASFASMIGCRCSTSSVWRPTYVPKTTGPVVDRQVPVVLARTPVCTCSSPHGAIRHDMEAKWNTTSSEAQHSNSPRHVQPPKSENDARRSRSVDRGLATRPMATFSREGSTICFRARACQWSKGGVTRDGQAGARSPAHAVIVRRGQTDPCRVS